MLKTRILSSVIGLPLLFATLFYRGNLLLIFVVFLSFIGMYEYYRCMEAKKLHPVKWYGYITTLLYYIILIFGNNPLFTIGLFCLSIICLFSIEVMRQKHDIVDIAITIAGFFYVPILFSHLFFIGKHDLSKIIIWLPFITAFICDTSAYFVGVYFGKNKLCPAVSPKKTIEGAIGGVVGSIVFTFLFGYLINRMGYTIPIVHFLILGFLCGIVAELGDLWASYLKRFAGIKDYGNIIPGHGGVLDRFDSVLFTSPVVFYYFLFIVR